MIGRKKDAAENASAYGQLKALAERQQALELELKEVSATVSRLAARLEEWCGAREFSAQEGTVEVLVATAQDAVPAKPRSVKAEVKAVIAAAAAAAGEMAKTRKPRAVPAGQDTGSAWSQQGRVGVVSSHNLR